MMCKLSEGAAFLVLPVREEGEFPGQEDQEFGNIHSGQFYEYPVLIIMKNINLSLNTYALKDIYRHGIPNYRENYPK